MKVNTCALLMLTLPALAAAETLVVNVSGVQVGKGELRIGVFDDPEQFPDGTYLKGVAIPGDVETMRLEIDGLEPGQYAVSVFQDFNGNEVVDKNVLGMPKEPYGFSGDWKSGGASFAQAVIVVLEGGGTEITINMR